MAPPPELPSDRIVLAGIDEAGYGPLLGPLCIGACAISVPAAFDAPCRLTGHPDLWQMLAAAVTEDARTTDRRTVVCDSKRLHDPKNVRPIEQTVLTLLAATAEEPGPAAVPATFRDYLARVSLTPPTRLTELPWYAGDALAEPLPVAALAEKCWMRGQSLAACLAACETRVEGIRVEPVDVPTFNALIESAQSKADAELSVIGHVLRKLWQRFPRLRVVVDRLGARDYYAAALRDLFPEAAVEVLAEAHELPALPPLPGGGGEAKRRRPALAPAGTGARKRAKSAADEGPPRYSRYRLHGEAGAELDVAFATDGERVALPVAVASLFAKYLREGCMRALNRYWQARVPDLRPTKGYVQDGRRFLADLEAALGSDVVAAARPQLVRNR